MGALPLPRPGRPGPGRAGPRGRGAGAGDVPRARGPGERWLEVRAFPHRDGLSAYLRDVTERRRSQEVQAHLLGITGHDLRTPISVVRVSLDVALRDAQLSERNRRVLARASGAAARMSRLVNDLLDYSRARLGKGIPIARGPPTSTRSAGTSSRRWRAPTTRKITLRARLEAARASGIPTASRRCSRTSLTNAVRYEPRGRGRVGGVARRATSA